MCVCVFTFLQQNQASQFSLCMLLGHSARMPACLPAFNIDPYPRTFDYRVQIAEFFVLEDENNNEGGNMAVTSPQLSLMLLLNMAHSVLLAWCGSCFHVLTSFSRLQLCIQKVNVEFVCALQWH